MNNHDGFPAPNITKATRPREFPLLGHFCQCAGDNLPQRHVALVALTLHLFRWTLLLSPETPNVYGGKLRGNMTNDHVHKPTNENQVSLSITTCKSQAFQLHFGATKMQLPNADDPGALDIRAKIPQAQASRMNASL